MAAPKPQLFDVTVSLEGHMRVVAFNREEAEQVASDNFTEELENGDVSASFYGSAVEDPLDVIDVRDSRPWLSRDVSNAYPANAELTAGEWLFYLENLADSPQMTLMVRTEDYVPVTDLDQWRKAKGIA